MDTRDATGPSDTTAATGRNGWSLIGLANVLLRRRRIVAGCALLTPVVTVGLGLLLPDPPPGAVASFRAPGELAAALGSASAVRLVLEEGEDPREPGDPTAAAVARGTRVRLAAEPDLWELAVQAGRPELSLEIARRILALEPGRLVAGPELEWERVEERLDRAWAELRAAEGELERFVRENPRYESSAALRVERDRLEGRVELRRSLVHDAERDRVQAEMALLRARPRGRGPASRAEGLRVVERPALRPPARAGLPYLALLGLLAGLALGVLWALAREGLLRLGRRDPEAYAEFRRLVQETGRDLRRPWRAFFG